MLEFSDDLSRVTWTTPCSIIDPQAMARPVHAQTAIHQAQAWNRYMPSPWAISIAPKPAEISAADQCSF
jgi:hypothetical protein